MQQEVQLQSAAPEDARSHGFAFFADVRRTLSLSTLSTQVGEIKVPI